MAEYQGIAERQPNAVPPLPEPQRLSADRGWHWIMDAFRLVKPYFGVWFLLCLIFFIIMMVLSAVPAGSFVWMLLQPILGAGLMFACSELERGEEPEIGHLFIGFQRNPTQLALLGLIACVASIAIILIAAIPFLMMGGFQNMSMFLANPGAPMTPVFSSALVALLLFLIILLVLWMPLTMAMWFATALVLFDNLPAWPAFKISYRGCMANLMPFLVFGLIGMVLCVVAAMPLGLGLFLLVPVLFATGYTSYRDVFGAEPL